jgi:Coenzyme PQQ synthesis protein D (PqqD)
MAITLDTTLSRNGDIFYASVDPDQAVMLNVAAGEYYGLNAVAARIWELLDHPKTLVQLCAQICEEFEVELEICEAAVLKFADEIIDNGIVQASAA